MSQNGSNNTHPWRKDTDGIPLQNQREVHNAVEQTDEGYVNAMVRAARSPHEKRAKYGVASMTQLDPTKAANNRVSGALVPNI